MKIAISAKSSKGLEAEVDRKFGRALFFAIVNTEDMEVVFIANPAKLEAGGAGVMAAQTIANKNVAGVISGDFGPKAFNGLKSANLKMYLFKEGTIKEAVNAFKKGKLEKLTKPTK